MDKDTKVIIITKTIGIIMVLSGIWVPFLMGGLFPWSPSSSPTFKVWEMPMIFTLLLFGIVSIAYGTAVVCRAVNFVEDFVEDMIEKLEDNESV